ncbi:unnamed protein product [Psylliodes chrysocephalus]|uniref:Uncharacterized protein n=1 Tax=Psylliodes chrysocephalus TaxID=3402493 RepID=A0A9P0CLD9_9CUCU|nr:unnamed protein product [Psylliodes chrysocephala]
MKIRLIFCLHLILFTQYGFCAMSEKQMNATKKLVRNTCVTKTKVSPDVVDAMHKGDFSQGQCYLSCILNTYKLILPEGTFDWEGGIKAINANMPPNIAEPACETVKNCKDSMKTKTDKCIGAAEIAKCLYDDNPSNYFLP